MLNELIKEFLEINHQEEELKAKKDELSAQIKALLEKEPNEKFVGSNGSAKLVSKTTFTYNDETAIMNYIISKGFSDVYLTKKINTTKFNSELKTKGALYDATKSYFTENVSKSLEVK